MDVGIERIPGAVERAAHVFGNDAGAGAGHRLADLGLGQEMMHGLGQKRRLVGDDANAARFVRLLVDLGEAGNIRPAQKGSRPSIAGSSGFWPPSPESDLPTKAMSVRRKYKAHFADRIADEDIGELP
jgi:hypothetical protein